MDNRIPSFSVSGMATPKPRLPQTPVHDGSFLDTFEGAMRAVESMQTNADSKISQTISGQGQDIHSTMIAVEKADLAFQLMMQVRNKIVQAYQEISRMPF